MKSIARRSSLSVLLLALSLSGCVSLPAGRLEGGAPSIHVPARFFGEHVLVPVRLAGAGPAWLMLDTGAQLTILDLATARQLGITVSGTVALEGLGAESVSGGVTAEPIAIQVAGSQPYVLHRPVADLSPLEPFLGMPFAGVLGGDLFQRFVVEIDYDVGHVILHDPRRFRPRADDAYLPLEVDRQLPFVRGAVVLADGRELSGRFQIDTGARGSLTLYSPFVRSHGLIEALPATVAEVAAGVGGEMVVKQGRLRAFRMGPFLLDEPTASLSTAEAGLTASAASAGHIGAEVLRRFTVTIDYRRGALYLRPNQRVGEPFDANMAGMGLRSAGPEFREHTVDFVDAASPAERAGLEPGDVLLEVDGRPAVEFTLPEFRALISRQQGRLLQLLVRRGDQTLSIPIRLERRI
jgi:hypothetical protein